LDKLEGSWKSEGCCGAATLETGKMDTDFHCFGTTDENSERFIISTNGAAKGMVQGGMSSLLHAKFH